MTDDKRQTELNTAFLKAIETIGAEQLKKSSIFIRNVDDNQSWDAAPADTAHCCVCGVLVDTREIGNGGDTEGCQLSDGSWVCSSECWDVDQ